MNRSQFAEAVTIIAGVATVLSCVWSYCISQPQKSGRLEGHGLRSLLSDDYVGKSELTDQQIDQIAVIKVQSILDMRPLVHRLFADIRNLKKYGSEQNYNLSAVNEAEERILKDRELIIKKKIKDKETIKRISGL